MQHNDGCKCGPCQSACSYKPGWFKPGEVEKVAEFLNTPLQDLFNTKLSVDWWEGGFTFDNDVFVLSPAVVGGNPGEEFDGNPLGTCVFYVNNECSIHEVKPFECAKYMHDDPHDVVSADHRSVAEAWENEEGQAQIEKLLGHPPIAVEYMGAGGIFGYYG